MFKIISTFLLSLLLASCVLQIKQSGRESLDQQAVRQTFLAYKYALLNNLGKDASDLVSQKTIDHYARLRKLALTGQPAELERLPPFNKLVVIAIRHNIPGEQLQKMSAKEVFAHGVKEEWISKSSVAPYEIGTISVYGDYASAEILLRNKPVDTLLEFRKENDVWRLNLMPLLQIASQRFALQLTQNHADEDKVILQIVESVSGRKVSNDIWNPTGKVNQSAAQ